MSNNTDMGNMILSNAIMFILKHDNISAADLVVRFKFTIESATGIIETMHEAGILGEPNEYHSYPLIVNSIDDLDEGIIEFLKENGLFSDEDISNVFKALTTEEKNEISNILLENRNWVNANEDKPEMNIPVVIRMVNKHKIYNENRTEVMYAEDMKIASWDGEKWTIIPPYPKFDYSPLSKYGELKEGTVVSHWGDILEDELENWNNRFNRLTDYKVNIEVDPDYEEDVYRALLWGATYIARFGGTDFTSCPENKGLRKIYNTLCDLQAVFDNQMQVGDE